MLTGNIPSSLGSLSNLESLDLSYNKISGEIPQQLAQLNFLQSLDISHNNLMGPIPQSNQFNTFENSSFVDNPGLCGKSLSKKCENPNASRNLLWLRMKMIQGL
ncbi:LRR domain containing protein [Parasponia andersonii]|uniref:LRR domain containing protein n=1 Tax=Parasponia andersonii TaxID=3476 RepID=A0A2P5CII5_PARAD|nr:LRR domain containing protein [Parasponia andersonii]